MLPSQVEFFRHILDECKYIRKEYNENSFDDFMQNERLSKAVCRSLEIIGEACNKYTPIENKRSATASCILGPKGNTQALIAACLKSGGVFYQL